MSEIKEKVEMELKPLEAMCEATKNHLNLLITGANSASAEEILAVAKTYGEIVDAKKDIVEMCYRKELMKAMEKSEYGEDFDEDGPKYYGGRRMRRYYTAPVVAADVPMADPGVVKNYPDGTIGGRVYYTPDVQRRMYNTGDYSPMNESRYDRNKRHFTEAKMTPGEKPQELEEFLNTFQEDFTAMIPKLTPAEKTQAKQKFTAWAQKIQ